MTSIRKEPCTACPYRMDVPSGVWAAHEYEKLEAYDLPTADQPPGAFGCHATPEHLCHGWAVVHGNQPHDCYPLALRLLRIEPEDIPAPAVQLFSSGAEASAHGKRDIKEPTVAAQTAVVRLLKKHSRLRDKT